MDSLNARFNELDHQFTRELMKIGENTTRELNNYKFQEIIERLDEIEKVLGIERMKG
jgi:hypothetical protein